mmetsp:Transcript_27437/g.50562  ORF Transcript_27437/g.50562 Transcript_27437/m.50562 type:complete len:330 (-) Transcript_27437:3428-4417(-)
MTARSAGAAILFNRNTKGRARIARRDIRELRAINAHGILPDKPDITVRDRPAGQPHQGPQGAIAKRVHHLVQYNCTPIADIELVLCVLHVKGHRARGWQKGPIVAQHTRPGAAQRAANPIDGRQSGGDGDVVNGHAVGDGIGQIAQDDRTDIVRRIDKGLLQLDRPGANELDRHIKGRRRRPAAGVAGERPIGQRPGRGIRRAAKTGIVIAGGRAGRCDLRRAGGVAHRAAVLRRRIRRGGRIDGGRCGIGIAVLNRFGIRVRHRRRVGPAIIADTGQIEPPRLCRGQGAAIPAAALCARRKFEMIGLRSGLKAGLRRRGVGTRALIIT